jgi:autotransporter-associated beta strand protein
MILPAALITSASAAEITWNGSQNPFTLSANLVFGEGLHEGFVNQADNETTPIGGAIVGPDNGQGAGVSLGLRMAQSTLFGATDWANNRTWIYNGEAFTGPNGVISFAANNDDTDWLKLNGVVVLNDNGWNTANAVTITGLTPNSWVPFEYRVSDTGAGGAGPSAQNNPAGAAGWNNTTGAVMSFNAENGSLNANDYIGGPNDLGKPTEVANGTPELFRFFIGNDAGGDNIHVTATSTATLTGTASEISENQLSFEAGATPVTLTFNNSDAVQRTLAANQTTFGNANGATAIFAGSGNVRVGQATDGSFTGITVVKDGGTGDLIFDTATNDLDGTTLRANNGRISIQGNGFNPISTLTTPIQISNAAGTVRFGAAGTGVASTIRTTFANGLAVNESGTLEHASAREDLLTGPVTIAPTKTLNAKIDGGTMRLTGAVTGGNITKTGAGTLRLEGTTQLDAVSVSGGTIALNGNTTLTNTPVISSGGTLALTGVGTAYTFPGPMVVSTGGTLRTYAAPIGTRQTNLTGGTLILDGEHGLSGEYWNIAPPNVSNAHPGWGPITLTQGVGNSDGTNTPGGGDFTGFQNGYTGLGPAPLVVNTTDNGVTSFNFPSVDTAPFEVYGVPYVDNIQARWTGKFYAPVAGIYALSTTSDDGSAVFIDGASVVYNNAYQGMTNRGGSVFLQPGLHDITMGFYEGTGGAGLQVFVTPPGGTNQLLNNSMLFTTGGNNTFSNPIDIQQDSTIRTDHFEAIAADLTIQPGRKLTTEGNTLTATVLKMRTSGTYTLNTSGASNILVASRIDDNAGAAALTINKVGAGVFALDNTTTAQLTNAASVININEGSLGILLQSGGLSPTGNAAINFNGGGFVLSSKGGDQTYPLPPSGFGGTAPVVQARQIGSGVAGPVNITLGGNLKIPANQTLGLKTSGAYKLLVGGTPDLSGGAGTLSIIGGQVATTTPTAINGLNLALNATEPATLRVVSNTVALNSLSSSGRVPANLVIGTGTGKATLTVNGPLTTSYTAALTQVTGTTASLIKDGTGKLSISGTSNFSDGVTINSGTLNANAAALGTGPITLAGGILQGAPSGLLGEYWDSTVGGDTGAQPGLAGDLATFNSYFAGKGSPIVSALTSTAGRTNLKFSDGPGLEGGGPDTATFADQGFNATNNFAVRLSGSIFIPVAGDYVFTTRSDDGSVIFLDGVKVVDNNVYQPMTTISGAPVTLTVGAHQISIGFYEGGGGSGLEVRYTPPGGQDQFISNQVLGGLHATNAVVLTAPSTIDPEGGAIDLGPLTLPPSTALTGLNGNITFASTVLTGTGGNTYAINKSTGVLNLGGIADGGTAVVINKTGTGTLLFAAPTAAQLTNAATQINVNAGSVAAVGGGAINPLGAATVNLNGGGLILSSSTATSSLPNTVNVTGASSLGAGNLGGGAVDAASVTLTKPLSVSGGASLALSTTNDYILNLPTITGGGKSKRDARDCECHCRGDCGFRHSLRGQSGISVSHWRSAKC